MAAVLLAWDAGTARRPYRWRSRLHLNPVPTSYQAAQVRAADYDDLTLRIFADGVLLFERVITSDQPFVTPPLPQRGTYIELEGTSRAFLVELAEDMEELS